MQSLLPERIDNRFDGPLMAVWVFGALTAITLARSLVHVFLPDGGAGVIATIPLDRMPGGGAEAVVSIFALWGLSQLLLGVIQGVVLLRYRALIPAMYALLLVEYLARLAIGSWKPVPTIDTPPGAVANVVLPVVLATMLVLSRRPRSTPAARSGTAGRSVTR